MFKDHSLPIQAFIFSSLALCLIVTFYGLIVLYESPYTGLRLSPCNGKTCIDAVDADSPASAAGIKAGDLLVAVNGEEVPFFVFSRDPDWVRWREDRRAFRQWQRWLDRTIIKNKPLALTIRGSKDAGNASLTPARFPLTRAFARSLPVYLGAWGAVVLALLVLRKRERELSIVNFGVWIFVCLNGVSLATYAADPAGVHVTVYQTDLFSSATGTAVTVFTDPAGKTVDIVGNPDVFGSGMVTAGTYKRIKFTVQNQVSFSGPNPDPSGLCSGLTPTVSGTFLIDGTKAAADQVDLYFATSDDGGSSGWTSNGTVNYPFLIQTPVEVQADKNTVVKLIFNTAGTLVCSAANTATVNPPTMSALNYVVQAPSAACTFPAEYWVVTYNLFSSLSTTNPMLQEQLSRAGVDSGWGAFRLHAPDPTTHEGAWQFVDDPTTSGEHNHGMGWYDTTSGYQGFYVPPAGTSSYYILNGGKIVLYGDGFRMEGAFSKDCSTMIGVELTGGSDNNLLYAIKKPSGLASTLPADSTYIQISNGVEIQYDMVAPNPHPAQGLTLANSFSVWTTANNGEFFEWNPKLMISAMSSTTWSPAGPGNTARFDINQNATFTANVSSDGIVTSSDPTMTGIIRLGANGSGMMAGDFPAGPNDSDQSKHRLNAGLWLNPLPSPVLSDLTGTWVIGALETNLRDADATWGNGNEYVEAGISYGDFTITGATGQMCGVFTHRNILNKTMSYESGCWTVELHTECYSCDQATPNPTCLDITTPAASCSTGGNPGIVVPVFYMVKESVVDAKFALDKTKTTIGIWKPIQKTPTPTQCFPGMTSPTCPNSATDMVAGMGVKL